MQDIEEGIAIDPPQSQNRRNTSASKRGTAATNEVQSSSSNSNSLENNIDGFNKLEDDFHENSQHENDNHATTTTKYNNPTYKSLISSSVVCFIIYFVFCIVFSSVVWDPLNSSLDTAVDLLTNCQSKVIVCGVGKSGIIASKISATLEK
mgnify:CR=1 FL=1